MVGSTPAQARHRGPGSIGSPALAGLLGKALQSGNIEGVAVIGEEPAGPRPEYLMGLASEIPSLNVSVLVVARRQDEVELSLGILYPPRSHRVVPGVLPGEFRSKFGESTIDEKAVFGEARSLRPRSPDLDPHLLIPATPRTGSRWRYRRPVSGDGRGGRPHARQGARSVTVSLNVTVSVVAYRLHDHREV